MYPLLYEIALRLGLGILLGFLLMMFITILETAFYKQNKQIHFAVIVVLIALIVYALGDIAIDVLGI
jgi:NhaP-type Na+/H+ or K+/H+ antiporter